MENKCDYIHDREFHLNDTLTVKQLIEILKKYPCDMKVMTTWESTVHELKEENIYETCTGKLYLDAYENFYKKEFQK
jgi:hypothetical protein